MEHYNHLNFIMDFIYFRYIKNDHIELVFIALRIHMSSSIEISLQCISYTQTFVYGVCTEEVQAFLYRQESARR